MVQEMALSPGEWATPDPLNPNPSFLWFACPECEEVGMIDADQFHGRVSMICPNEACDFHMTINLAQKG